MVESLSDLQGDLMLIPCPPGILVFVLLLLPLAVFFAYSGFQVVWMSLVHQDWKLEESGRPWACLNGSRSSGLRHVLAWPPL